MFGRFGLWGGGMPNLYPAESKASEAFMAGAGSFVTGDGFWKNSYYQKFEFTPLPVNFGAVSSAPEASSSSAPDASSDYSPTTGGASGAGGTPSANVRPQVKAHETPQSVNEFVAANKDNKGDAVDKPRVSLHQEEKNGRVVDVVRLEYDPDVCSQAQESERETYVDKIKNFLKDEAKNGNKDLAVEVGLYKITANEELAAETDYYGIKDMDESYLSEAEVQSSTLSNGKLTGTLESIYKPPQELTPVLPANKISVNKSQNAHYYVDLSREDGERQIRALTPDGNKEEVWVFVEYIKNGELYNRWFEIGFDEKPDKAKFYRESVNQIITELDGKGAQIFGASVYHQHPLTSGAGASACMPPSDDDLNSYVPAISGGNDYLIYVDERIVTSQGVYTIENFGDKITVDSEKYRKAVEEDLKKDPNSRATKVVHDLGFDCRFVYF
jgi:hypothetical protein